MEENLKFKNKETQSEEFIVNENRRYKVSILINNYQDIECC